MICHIENLLIFSRETNTEEPSTRLVQKSFFPSSEDLEWLNLSFGIGIRVMSIPGEPPKAELLPDPNKHFKMRRGCVGNFIPRLAPDNIIEGVVIKEGWFSIHIFEQEKPETTFDFIGNLTKVR